MVSARMVRALAMLGCAAFVGCAVPAGAQSEQTAIGSVLATVGLGSGSASFTCGSCAPQHQVSVAGRVRAAVLVGPSVALGLDVAGWGKRLTQPAGQTAIQLGFADVVGQWYPAGGSEFFVTAGGGVALFRAARGPAPAAGPDFTSQSPALVFGLGWDLRLGARVGVTPYVDFYTATGGRARLTEAGPLEPFRPSLVQVGIGLSVLPPRRDPATGWLLPRAGTAGGSR